MGLLAGKTLAAAVAPGDTHLTITPPLALGDNPAGQPIEIGDELMRVAGGKRSTLGLWRPADSAHAQGAAITELNPFAATGGAGAGGVTVDNQSDPPAEVTTLIAPGADVSTPGEATLAAGSQTISRIGPYRVRHSDAGIDGDGLALGDALPDDAAIITLWAVVVEAWSAPTELRVGLVNGDVAMGDTSYSIRYPNVDAGTGVQVGAWSFAPPQDPAFPTLVAIVDGADTKLWATTTAAGTTGEADIYAIIAEAAA